MLAPKVAFAWEESLKGKGPIDQEPAWDRRKPDQPSALR